MYILLLLLLFNKYPTFRLVRIFIKQLYVYKYMQING